MLFSSLIKTAAVAASLLTSAIAAPAAHLHNQHKRDVVVVTETEVVYITAGVPQAVAGESTTVTWSTVDTNLAAPTEVSSTVVLQAQVAGASTHVTDTSSVAAAVQTAAASTSTSAASLPTSSSSVSFTSGKGITYSPYTSSGACKSLSEVKSDLAQLSGYEIIRLYGVDCNQVENVLQAKAEGQKLFLGIYFVDQIAAGISEIAAAIKSYGSWGDVHTVSIGNELVNSGSATVDQIASYVATGRSALTAAGYTGPVVSVDTHIATINNPGLCDISDYVAINAHAYFDYNTEASGAGEWLLLQIQRVWSACGGSKSVLVTETGWPHQGDTYGVAVASPAAQAAAISSIKATCGSSAILFNAFDDLWKADGAQHCEKYWGLL
jgi:exo-beta-1,3-glucanase (GH17 family)